MEPSLTCTLHVLDRDDLSAKRSEALTKEKIVRTISPAYPYGASARPTVGAVCCSYPATRLDGEVPAKDFAAR